MSYLKKFTQWNRSFVYLPRQVQLFVLVLLLCVFLFYHACSCSIIVVAIQQSVCVVSFNVDHSLNIPQQAENKGKPKEEGYVHQVLLLLLVIFNIISIDLIHLLPVLALPLPSHCIGVPILRPSGFFREKRQGKWTCHMKVNYLELARDIFVV